MSRRAPARVTSASRRSQPKVMGEPNGGQRIGSTPRARIQQVARGELQLTIDDLHGVLADHLMGADEHARQLNEHRGTLLRMITEGAAKKGPADLLSALDAISRLDTLQRSSSSELRKLCELLWRMAGPTRPRVEILDARPKPAGVSLRRS